jgi:hypothetical protein
MRRLTNHLPRRIVPLWGALTLSACTTLGPDFQEPEVAWLHDWQPSAYPHKAAPEAPARGRSAFLVAAVRRSGAQPAHRYGQAGESLAAYHRAARSGEPAATETSAAESVKRGSLGVLALILLSLSWYFLADRFTPYTSQVRVQGFVVAVAPKVAGLVTEVWVKNDQ